MTRQPASDREAVLARERAALEQWAGGNPAGYVAHATADASYFDDIAAPEGIAGGDALRAYAAGLAGRIPPHAFEVIDPVVQLAGDAAVLAYRYQPTAPDGTAMPPWRATAVYRREDGEWRLLHAHWSIQKQA